MVNLQKANELLKEISANNKYITPVTRKDYDLFQSYFSKERHTYGNSWAYVVQGAYGTGPNNLGYKYYDGTNLSMVCIYPKVEKPDINVFFWVRPMGKTVFDVIANLSKELLEQRKMPTYVKKIFQDQFEYLQQKGFKDTQHFPWHSSCPSEDDTLEELIMDLNEFALIPTVKESSKRLLKLFKNTEKFAKDNIIRLLDVDPHKEIAWNVVTDFFSNVKSKYMISSKNDYHNFIFNSSNSSSLYTKIVTVNGDPAAFFCADILSEEYASCYAMIVHRYKFKYLSEYVMVDLFNALKKKGVRFVNLGGSEYQGVEDAKMKYHPAKKQQMYWASLYE